MKRIAMVLLAALLACACAAAETLEDAQSMITLPEGFELVAEAEMEGYRQAAAQDTGAAYAGESLLAVRDEAAISLVSAPSAYEDTRVAADALLAEYAQYVEGFENVEAQYVEAGGREFALIQVALDGEAASQYLLLEGGTLYVLTFVGVDETETLAVLESFAPAAEADGGEAAAEETPVASEEPDASAEPDVSPEPEAAAEPEASPEA